MGDALGHVNRARIVAQEMRRHDFLFVGGGKVHNLKEDGYPVEDLPVPGTFYRNNRVDILATVRNALKVFLGGRSVVTRLAEIIDHFDPDLILTDYEYFTPMAARGLGRMCVSLDHQHVVTHCLYDPPGQQRLSGLMTSQVIRRLYSRAGRYLIISFFQLPPATSESTEVFPPILRRSILRHRPTEDEHVVVYQTSPTFHRLFPILEQMGDRFFIYGFGEKPAWKNLVFKGPSEEGFLQDLASCRYAITNGGHNVVSEALYLGKPVFSFPIANAYEQFLNAHFLARLGYGAHSVSLDQSEIRLKNFTARLDEYRRRIKKGSFFGNRLVRSRLEELTGHAHY